VTFLRSCDYLYMKLLYTLIIVFLTIGSIHAQQKDSTHATEQIIDPVETIPEFTIGGIDLKKYIQQQTKEWKTEFKDSINGKLYLQFTVTQMAEIKNIIAVKKIGSIPEKIEKRAKQLLEKTKVSGPATLQGHPIEIRVIASFKF